MLLDLKKSLVFICLTIFALLSLLAAILSYYRLDNVPYGFHVDEMSGAVDIGCLTTEGVDAHNVPHPVFSNLNYGTPKPPTYIYPAVLWAKIFGYSVPSLRALSVTVHLLGLAGLLLLARNLFGWPCALITLTVASLSPWTWGISRVAFESLFSATFLIWGLFFFFRSLKSCDGVAAGLCFVIAMYSYPPFRVQTPLMLVSLMLYSYWKNPRPFSYWLMMGLSVILPAIPLVQKTVSGEVQKRFNMISIFSRDYLNSIHSAGHWWDLMAIFISNYLQHLQWDFLFLTGDPSYVHSTRHFGILSWLDMAALLVGLIFLIVLLIKKNNPIATQGPWVILLIVNILIGIVPAALTNSELPNSLRITGSWPFVCLLSGFLLWKAAESWWGIWLATCLLSVCFACAYFYVYFEVFPEEGKGMFGYWTLQEAKQLKSDEDWLKFIFLYRYQDYNARYFLMQYKGMGCTESRKAWEGLRDYLTSHGEY